jgi:hypothetical protein
MTPEQLVLLTAASPLLAYLFLLAWDFLVGLLILDAPNSLEDVR